MKKENKVRLKNCVAGVFAATALVWHLQAADANEEIIKDVMKTYHKAPKGVDAVYKKAIDGTATPDELKKLVAAYQKLATTKPLKGDATGWKDKTSKLLAAAQALEKGTPGAVAQYKEAVNCKACHSVYKPN